MKHTEIKQVEQEVVTDVTCDCCGKSCNTEYGYEYMTLHAQWGFMTEKDLEHWEAHLCEKCVDERLGFIKFNKTGIR